MVIINLSTPKFGGLSNLGPLSIMAAAPAEPVSPRRSVARQPGEPRENRRLSGVCLPKACAGEIASRPRAGALRIRALAAPPREMPPPRRSDHWDHERRTCAFASKTAPETGKSDIAYSSNTLLWTPKGPLVFNRFFAARPRLQAQVSLESAIPLGLTSRSMQSHVILGDMRAHLLTSLLMAGPAGMSKTTV